jgi:hypothetical protein
VTRTTPCKKTVLNYAVIGAGREWVMLSVKTNRHVCHSYRSHLNSHERNQLHAVNHPEYRDLTANGTLRPSLFLSVKSACEIVLYLGW